MAAGRGQNKNRQNLWVRLRKEFPNWHPIVEMARTANDENEDPTVRFQANKEVAQYLMPKLKAVEITGAEGGPVEVRQVKSLESALAILQEHGIETAEI